jgi:hypothetical protein
MMTRPLPSVNEKTDPETYYIIIIESIRDDVKFYFKESIVVLSEYGGHELLFFDTFMHK